MIREMMELNAFREIFGGSDSWSQAVFLAGVFLVLLFRRDQIISPYMFRISIILFVLAIMLPVTMIVILQLTMNGGGGGRLFQSGAEVLLPILMLVVGPVLFGLAVLFCVLSMLPQISRYPAPPSRPPQPHPLD